MDTILFARQVAQQNDGIREDAICLAYRLFVEADSPNQAIAWRNLKCWINCRSPEQVARLERERGLVRS
jgi:hypothetical protein